MKIRWNAAAFRLATIFTLLNLCMVFLTDSGTAERSISLLSLAISAAVAVAALIQWRRHAGKDRS